MELHFLTFDIYIGQGQYGERDIVRQAQDYLICSQEHLVNFRRPQLVFAFYNAVTKPIATELRNLGVHVVGTEVDVDETIEKKLQAISVDGSDDSESELVEKANVHGDLTLKETVKTSHVEKQNLPCDLENIAKDDTSVDTKTIAQTVPGADMKESDASSASMRTCQQQIGCEQTSTAEISKCDIPNTATSARSLSISGYTCDDTIKLDTQKETAGTKSIIRETDSLTCSPADIPLSFADTSNLHRVEKQFCFRNDMTETAASYSNSVACSRTSDGDSVIEFIETELLLNPLVDYSVLGTLIPSNEINFLESIEKINLDVTALITLVSSVSHGGCHFKFGETILTEQAAEERTNPVLPKLQTFLSGNL